MAGKKPKRRSLGWVWGVLLAAAIVAYGGWYVQNQAAEAKKLPVGVQTGKAERGNIDQKITATGVAAAQTGAKVNIGSQISGRVRSLPADVGAMVHKGQVVAVLDAPDLQAQVEQQRQSVAASEANLAQADSRLRQANLNATLSKEQTAAQISEANYAMKGAEERVRMAEAQTKLQPTQTTAEIARAETALSTARSQERQVKQTVNLQLQQAQSTVDDAQEALGNARRLLTRQRALLAQGYIAGQQVDDTRTAYIQAAARLKSANAALNIVKEKTDADLQAAHDKVVESEASLTAAKAGRLSDTMRAAEERSAREARRQAEATLKLRESNRTQDLVRQREVEEARSGVLQAKSSLEQARALLKYQQAQLDKAIIRSPIDGTVLTVATQQGETVMAGFQTQTLITVADLKRLEVRTYVDEVDIGRVHLGLPAEVRVESYPDRAFHGHVTKVASSSTVKDNVVTYETTVAVTDAGGLLRPDMTANVTVILGRTPNVLMVPSEAIHREVSRNLVYVLHREKQGKERVEERVVQTGVQDNSHVQITSGLKEGEEVVLAGLQRLGVEASGSQSQKGKKEQ